MLNVTVTFQETVVQNTTTIIDDAVNITVIEQTGRDGNDANIVGEISTGVIELDNVAGKIYGDDAELTGDLTIDDNTAKLGGAAIVYHRDSVAPNITTGLQKIELDSYIINNSNMITLQKIGASKLGVVYKTIVVPDVQKPSIPTNLVATNTTDTTTDLNWDASTDNVGVTNYKVYQDGVEIANPATNSYQVTGLTAETPYSFTVTALDEAGNESDVSISENITTTAYVPSTEYVIWEQFVKTQSSGNGQLIHSEETNNIDYHNGAYASRAINGDNSVVFTNAIPVTNSQMSGGLGLTNTYAGVTVDTYNMDIWVQIKQSGEYRIFEDGNVVKNTATYNANDTLKLKVIGTTISVELNGIEVYVSSKNFTLPLTPIGLLSQPSGAEITTSYFESANNLITSPL